LLLALALGCFDCDRLVILLTEPEISASVVYLRLAPSTVAWSKGGTFGWVLTAGFPAHMCRRRQREAAPALCARGARRPRRRERRSAHRAHAGGGHARRQVPAAQPAPGTVARSTEGRLTLRHSVSSLSLSPFLYSLLPSG
jgi:hypothetical protein